MLVLQLKAELCFNVLLKTHAKNVSVDRKLHLLGNAIKLRLLPLNNRGHLVESLLELIFKEFARTHLLNQALLVDIRLCLHCLVVAFKVGEDFIELLFFSVAGLECFLYCEQGSFKLLSLLVHLLG